MWANKWLGVSQVMFLSFVWAIAHMFLWKIVKRVYVPQCCGPVSEPSKSMLALPSHITMGTVSRGHHVCEHCGKRYLMFYWVGQDAHWFRKARVPKRSKMLT